MRVLQTGLTRRVKKPKCLASSGVGSKIYAHPSLSRRQRSWVLVSGRMPTRSHPFASDHDRNDMVQLQGDHRGTTAGGTPDNACPVFPPLKMARPALTTRIKQMGPPSGLRIARSDLRPLETIAQTAGQPKVLFRIRPATRLGQYMVDFQQPQHVALRTLAIATAVVSRSPNTRPHCG